MWAYIGLLMSENNIWKTKLFYKTKTLAYICLVHLVLKLFVKLKVNLYLCSTHKTNIQYGVPHSDSWRAAGWGPLRGESS